jgi:hypothetical protein
VAGATIVIGIFDTAYAGSVDSGMDAALIGGGAALLFAVFVAVISVHLLSQHIKRVMSSVDSRSDEQLAMAASGTRETTRTLTQRLLRAIRPVEEIDANWCNVDVANSSWSAISNVISSTLQLSARLTMPLSPRRSRAGSPHGIRPRSNCSVIKRRR